MAAAMVPVKPTEDKSLVICSKPTFKEIMVI